MPAFERDSLAFHYLHEGDRSGWPFVFQYGLAATSPNPPASSRRRRAKDGLGGWVNELYILFLARNLRWVPRYCFA